MTKLSAKMSVLTSVILMTISQSKIAFAQISNFSSCRKNSMSLVFVNGVQTTRAESARVRDEFKRLYGVNALNEDDIEYEILYNQTEKGLNDFVETFQQRLTEHQSELKESWDLLSEAIRGDDSWWDKLRGSMSSTMEVISKLGSWVQAEVFAAFPGNSGESYTEEDYKRHRAQIDQWLWEGKKLLFVAHSQGNLFANAAYKYALSKTNSDLVKIVHIAPASPRTFGSYTLANFDFVIRSLAVSGIVPNITDNIPPFFFRPPGINGQTDILGHGILEIYLNQKLEISNQVHLQIQTAINELRRPTSPAYQDHFNKYFVNQDLRHLIKHIQKQWRNQGGVSPEDCILATIMAKLFEDHSDCGGRSKEAFIRILEDCLIAASLDETPEGSICPILVHVGDRLPPTPYRLPVLFGEELFVSCAPAPISKSLMMFPPLEAEEYKSALTLFEKVLEEDDSTNDWEYDFLSKGEFNPANEYMSEGGSPLAGPSSDVPKKIEFESSSNRRMETKILAVIDEIVTPAPEFSGPDSEIVASNLFAWIQGGPAELMGKKISILLPEKVVSRFKVGDMIAIGLVDHHIGICLDSVPEETSNMWNWFDHWLCEARTL